MQNFSNPARSIQALCTALALSLGVSACMGGSGMNPAMMQAHSSMHAFSMAVDMGEIEEGQLAVARSTNPQVREFAQRMVTEHTAAMQKEEQMMASMGMGMMRTGMIRGGNTGAGAGMNAEAGAGADMNMDMGRMRAMLMENPQSRPVVEGHVRAMQMLQGLNGMAFDRAYMERQVMAHRYALENMDRMMGHMGMSGSMHAGAGGTMADHGAGMQGRRHSMMAMHQAKRAAIAMHLQMAQQIMASMR